jgi:hypothetical protein
MSPLPPSIVIPIDNVKQMIRMTPIIFSYEIERIMDVPWIV